MSRKETEQLRKKTKADLTRMVVNYQEKLKQLRFDLAAGKVKNVREMRKIKKELARTLTLLAEAAGEKNNKAK